MAVRAGQFREQIQLVFPSEAVSDGVGGWITSGEGRKVLVWARIQQLKGSQLLALGKEISSEVFRIYTRFSPTLLTADRLIWGNKDMKITSMTTDERRTEITIYATNGN
ncbi:phage head closure protein [Hymenobacter sp. NBH84]|uniref:phage head closure protein n=1 Tax=Hymenobacter sp. NBH84 TaxID=2596915 RepID=UPI00162A7A76|nr:phage head closure protein [Hymenobacter sp. NBH84]